MNIAARLWRAHAACTQELARHRCLIGRVLVACSGQSFFGQNCAVPSTHLERVIGCG